MFHLNNTINLTDISLFKNSSNGNSVTIPLGAIYVNTNILPSALTLIGYNRYSVSCNDDLQINLKINNSTSNNISLIKFKFNNDSIFKFIPGSFINTDTLDVYSSDSLEENITLQ